MSRTESTACMEPGSPPAASDVGHPATAGVRGRQRRTPPSHPTVLVVDDQDDFRYVLKLLLSRMGFSVIEARDGAEAMVQYLGDDVDVVLTDIFMPRMDGVELIRTLRALEPTVRIVAFSAAVETRLSGQGCCGDDVPLLAKPMEIDQLVAALRRALGNR
jgi:CheY-like chemotaxis protein